MSSLDGPNSRAAGIGIGLTIVGLGVLLLFDQTGLFGWHPSLERVAVPAHRLRPRAVRDAAARRSRATAAG